MNDGRRLPPGHRGLRLGGAPTTSVVVASTRGRDVLDRLLGWLQPACQTRSIEIVVARSCPPDEYHALETAYPSVLFMPAPDGANARQLRFVGLSAADGDIVTLIDDTMTMDEDWLADLPASSPTPVSSGAS
ncbi:MAG TPA: hypothetical protein VGI92_07355 [Gemmatimonadales bacterium]|jgi:hypothetical protein